MNNYKQKTEYVKNPAVMYVKKLENGTRIFNLIINANECPTPEKDGTIRLTGFINDFKKTDKQPDVNFRIPKERPERQQNKAQYDTTQKATVKQKDAPQQDSDAGGNDWF